MQYILCNLHLFELTTYCEKVESHEENMSMKSIPSNPTLGFVGGVHIFLILSQSIDCEYDRWRF